jgi:ubiquinone/menaquinone biosynthesis C-methylase UbiE
LGCGDGRILITAAQEFNAKAVGIEMSRDIYESTSAKVKSMGLADKIRVIHGNALHADLSGADVVTLYLLTSSNDRLKPVLAKMHPGARVVSHDYEIRGWKPISVSKVNCRGMVHTVYVYEIKPAA